jgi:transposase
MAEPLRASGWSRRCHWKTLTLVAALRDSVTAPYVIDGAMDGRSFLAYVEQVTNPEEARQTTCHHKVAGVREAIEVAGAELRYLPAYSPDLNRIENAYAKIKSDLRKRRRLHRRRTLEVGAKTESDCALRMCRPLQTRRLSCLIP